MMNQRHLRMPNDSYEDLGCGASEENNGYKVSRSKMKGKERASRVVIMIVWWWLKWKTREKWQERWWWKNEKRASGSCLAWRCGYINVYKLKGGEWKVDTNVCLNTCWDQHDCWRERHGRIKSALLTKKSKWLWCTNEKGNYSVDDASTKHQGNHTEKCHAAACVCITSHFCLTQLVNQWVHMSHTHRKQPRGFTDTKSRVHITGTSFSLTKTISFS